jgi:hypothetical protein
MNKTEQITSTARPLLLAAGAALLLAGCGSANNDNATTSSGSAPSKNIVSDAYRFSACMRGHGIPSYPDPHVVISKPGEQAIGIRPIPQSIASSPQFKAAQESCKGIMPPPENGSAKEQGEQGHARAQTLLAFAQCLRTHGVPGFPDPTAQGQLTPEMIHAAGVDLQAPSLLVAAKACVGVTHGAITLAQVEQAIHHPERSGHGEGSESSGGGEGSEAGGGR